MKRHFTVAWLVLIALAGCAGSPSPKTNYYVLSVEAKALDPARPAGAGSAPVTRVSVGRVAIPAVVDRQQMVASTASNSVEIFDFHRWAEPLQEALPRVLAGDLATQLGPGYAVSAGVTAGLPSDVRVSVDVQRFEAAMGGSVSVEALWNVRAAAGEARPGRSAIEEPVTEAGHAGIAAAYSRALAGVARDIAAAVKSAPALSPKKSLPP